MKKIKELWNNNRVMFVLTTIVIICFIVMTFVVVTEFFGVNSSSYGDRLSDIEGHPITEEKEQEIENKLKENEVVENVTVHTQGKIIYIRIVYQNVSIDRAKEIAASTIELISEEELKLYDVHYTIVQEKTENTEGFTLMGARNINSSGTIIWNNNTPFEVTTENEE